MVRSNEKLRSASMFIMQKATKHVLDGACIYAFLLLSKIPYYHIFAKKKVQPNFLW